MTYSSMIGYFAIAPPFDAPDLMPCDWQARSLLDKKVLKIAWNKKLYRLVWSSEPAVVSNGHLIR